MKEERLVARQEETLCREIEPNKEKGGPTPFPGGVKRSCLAKVSRNCRRWGELFGSGRLLPAPLVWQEIEEDPEPRKKSQRPRTEAGSE